eukprot:2488952-Amphidinium_carterae.1
MAVKSTATLKRRLGAMSALEEWSNGLVLPLEKEVLYEYVRHLESSGAAPTKAQSVVEAANFTHAMLDVQFKVSRRIKGVVARQLMAKPPTQQSDPLTALQVMGLERLMCELEPSPKKA